MAYLTSVALFRPVAVFVFPWSDAIPDGNSLVSEMSDESQAASPFCSTKLSKTPRNKTSKLGRTCKMQTWSYVKKACSDNILLIDLEIDLQ